MKHWLAVLSASLAIGLAGCSNKAPDTAPVDVSKPAITTSASVTQALATQIKVVNACSNRKDLNADFGLKEQSVEEYTNWFDKNCDPQVRNIIKASAAWKAATTGEKYSEFRDLTYAIDEAVKALQLLATLNEEWQSIIRNSIYWDYAMKDGHYSSFKLLRYKIGDTIQLMKLVEKDPSLKNRLTGGIKMVQKDDLNKYGLYGIYDTQVKAVAIQIPTWQEILDGKADVNMAIGVMQEK